VEGTPHKENWFSTGEVEFALQKRATNHYAGFREANQWVAPHLSRENTDTIPRHAQYGLSTLFAQVVTDVAASILSR
jgi:hypothetical protein